MNPPLAQVLQQHGRFVQSLARSLLRDAHLAEDVAQETWARYVERGPSAPGSLRHWLRTVTRNLATNVRRREAGRARRDERAARPEALPAASEELAQGEHLRRVIEAVLALEEPYRSTILARYYQGQDAQRIATTSGTPLATVRSREQRALKLLRERLERELGGGSAWALALGRLLEPGAPAAAVPTGTLAADWAVRAAWLAVGVAAVGVTWLALERRTDPRAATELAASAAPLVQPVEPGPSEPLATPTSATTTARVAAIPEPAPAGVGPRSARTGSSSSSGSSAAMQAALAEIRGRFVLPGGTPAVGATVAVQGWTGNEERELQYGVPADWQDPSTTTDADGRFTLRFDPPRAFQFALDAKLAGHAKASWRWHAILPGAVKDLGEVELPVGAIVEGRIVDRDGREVPGEWRVYADSLVQLPGEGREKTMVSAQVEPGTGRFRLVDLWPGANTLKAYSTMTNWVRGARVAAVSGEVVTADILYTGPDNSRRIAVTTSTEPFPFRFMDEGEGNLLRLSGPGVEGLRARQVEGSASTYSFEDLPPGEYTLELDDPRFLPWRQDGVRPGTAVRARLEGSSGLVLDVRGPDGLPLERYEVRVAFRNVNFWPREFRVHDGTGPLAGGRVQGMFPGDYTVTVLAEGLGSRKAEIDGLAAGETRGVVLTLAAAAALTEARTVTGRVVHADGTPVAGAEVVLLAPAEVEDSPASPVLRSGTVAGNPERWRRELGVTLSDAGGAFAFELVQPGGHALQAAHGPVLAVSSLRFEVPEGDPMPPVELLLPRGGRLEGRLLGPDGADFAGLRLWAVPTVEDFSGLGFDHQRETVVTVDPDGTYTLGPLPEGEYRVFLLLPAAGDESWSRSEGHVSDGVELGLVDVREGELAVMDLDVSQRLPREVALTVLVNGIPTASLDVTLQAGDPEDPTQLRGVTDASGVTRLRAFPGTYQAQVRDGEGGWSAWCVETVNVSGATSTSQTLVLATAAGTLACSRGGQPLAGELVSVLRASPHFDSWERVTARTTDASGLLELVLPPGEYALQRGRYRPGQDTPTVSLSWSSNGPLQAQVVFP